MVRATGVGSHPGDDQHAYDEAGGVLEIECSREGAGLRLVVEDDGAGLPPGFDPSESTSLGLSIVNTLVGELGGTITIGGRTDGPGTRVVVLVPDVAGQPR